MAGFDGFDEAIETLDQLIEGLPDEAANEVKLEVGDLAVEIIRERTARGLDPDGRPFAAYSPRYAERRRAQGLSAFPVDLESTGEMLDSLEARVTPDGVEIVVVGDAAVRADANNRGTDRLPQREFMDIRDEREIARLMEVAGDVAMEALEDKFGT